MTNNRLYKDSSVSIHIKNNKILTHWNGDTLYIMLRTKKCGYTARKIKEHGKFRKFLKGDKDQEAY